MTQLQKPVRAEISFTEEEYEEFIEGEVGYRIVSDEMIDQRRWAITHEMIIERLEDATFWRGIYQVGATENQHYDFGDRWFYNDDKAGFTEVFPKTVTITKYE